MIGKEEILECGWCGEKSSLEEWDSLTYAGCRSREMKRSFTSLQKESAYSKGNASYYQCPKCENWSRGNQVVFQNPKYKRLAGQPIIESVEPM